MKKRVIGVIFLILFFTFASASSVLDDLLDKNKNGLQNSPEGESNNFLRNVVDSVRRIFVREDAIRLTEAKLFDKESLDKRKNEIRTYGKDVEEEGIINAVIYDDFDNERSQIEYYLQKELGERTKIYFEDDLLLESGKFVVISGKKIGEEIFVEDFENILDTSVTASVQENPNLGEQRIAVFLVNSRDNRDEPITVAEAKRRVFDNNYFRNTWDGESFYSSLDFQIRKFSYGRTWLSGEVYGWYNLDLTEEELCHLDKISESAISAADNDLDFSNIERMIFVFPTNSHCKYGGLAAYGKMEFFSEDGNFESSIANLNGVNKIDSRTSSHELGHNFGINHANDIECGDEELSELSSNCISLEYGNRYDVMGSGDGDYGVLAKYRMGWLDENEIYFFKNGVNGILEIEPIDNSFGSRKKGVIFEIPVEGFSEPVQYGLEFRRRVSPKNEIELIGGSEGVFDGLIIDVRDRRMDDFDHTIFRNTRKGLVDFNPHDSRFCTETNGLNQNVDCTEKESVCDDLNLGICEAPFNGDGLNMIPAYEDSLDMTLKKGNSFYINLIKQRISIVDVKEGYLKISFSTSCGNGILNSGEQCDDGNNLEGDGCSSSCLVENCIDYDSDNILGNTLNEKYKPGRSEKGAKTYFDYCLPGRSDVVFEAYCDNNELKIIETSCGSDYFCMSDSSTGVGYCKSATCPNNVCAIGESCAQDCLKETHCSDDVDNDGDSKIDCLDYDCYGDLACAEINCYDTDSAELNFVNSEVIARSLVIPGRGEKRTNFVLTNTKYDKCYSPTRITEAYCHRTNGLGSHIYSCPQDKPYCVTKDASDWQDQGYDTSWGSFDVSACVECTTDENCESGEECLDNRCARREVCVDGDSNEAEYQDYEKYIPSQAEKGNLAVKDRCFTTSSGIILEEGFCDSTGGLMKTYPNCGAGECKVDPINGNAYCTRPSQCGDGISTFSEQCDDGNLRDGDGCSTRCTIESSYCGDKSIQKGEECDDGNSLNNDGCSSICKIEICADGDVTPEFPDGKNIFVKSSVTGLDSYGNERTYYDACSRNDVGEYYCLDGSVKREVIPCGEGYACSYGKCIIVQGSPISFWDRLWRILKN